MTVWMMKNVKLCGLKDSTRRPGRRRSHRVDAVGTVAHAGAGRVLSHSVSSCGCRGMNVPNTFATSSFLTSAFRTALSVYTASQ
jgi:hypothetical protein